MDNSICWVGKYVVRYAPRITNRIAGIPSLIAISLFIPFLNNAIFERLLKTWNTAVIPKTVLKSKNKDAIGTNRIEEPNPEIVPRISEMNARIIKRKYFSFIIYLSGKSDFKKKKSE